MEYSSAEEEEEDVIVDNLVHHANPHAPTLVPLGSGEVTTHQVTRQDQ